MTFRADHVAAILVVGVIGVLIPGLQPQLLGALALEGRLTSNALGMLATVELLAMGIGAGGAGFVLPVTRLRPIAVIALVATGGFDLLTPMLGTGAIFAARIGAGIGEGVLIWIAIGFIIRTRAPERWSGFYLAMQTLAQFGLASVFGLYVIDAGAGPGFMWLGIVTLAGLLAVPFMPRHFAPVEAHDEPSGAPPTRGIVALAGVVLYLAFIVSVWVYVEPLALDRGIPSALIHVIAPLSLAMQVLGAGAATLLAGRLPARGTIILAGLVNLALLAVMAAPPSPVAFVAATAVFGFLWLFALPFQIPVGIAADPSRRTALLIGGAQLTGSSLGPLFASMLVGGNDVTPVLWFGTGCAVTGVVVLLGAGTPRRS